MSFYAIVTKNYEINLAKFADQQKNQTGEKIRTEFLKHTTDKELAENFLTLTAKISEPTKAHEKFCSSETKNEKPAIRCSKDSHSQTRD